MAGKFGKSDIFIDLQNGGVKESIDIGDSRFKMSRFKFVKRGVKRQHSIIEGILPILEQMAKIDGIKKIAPATISYSPKRGIAEPHLRFQRENISGFKLSAHSRGCIQDIYVYVDGSKRKEVEEKLKKLC